MNSFKMGFRDARINNHIHVNINRRRPIDLVARKPRESLTDFVKPSFS